MPVAVTEVQRIPTSGARAVAVHTVDGLELLAVAQLANDQQGEEPQMNGGDSDTQLLLFRREHGRFEPFANLPVPGGEDAEFFTIDNRTFLATASIRTGAGPYEYDTDSCIFEWNATEFVPFQKVRTYAAKQWRHWQISGRHFLGLAQGVALPGLGDNRDSVVFEWDGTSFTEQQHIPSRWAYNWHAFAVDDSQFVAHAEHVGASNLYRWEGDRLQPHQELLPRGGRSFATFDDAGSTYLVALAIDAPSVLMRWTGARFEVVQTLEGLGARELHVVHLGGRIFVVRINFILGSPAAPVPDLDSEIYEFGGGSLHRVATFPTTGATDVAVLSAAGCRSELVVTNSLTPNLRFATESVVYAMTADPS